MTLLSFERYREADVVNFRFATQRHGSDHRSPELVVTSRGGGDARSSRVWILSGSGGGTGDELIWRFSYAIVPPAGDGVDLVVEVTRIEWFSYGRGERTLAATSEGPWRFMVRT